jgi:hypothetical protein
MASTEKKGTHLETKLLEGQAHVKAEILLPWLTKLWFETGVSNMCGRLQCAHVQQISSNIQLQIQSVR